MSDDRPFVYLDTSVALAHLLSETEVPRGVRTLDALHLASMLFLRSQGAAVELATYDRKPRAGAEALDFESYRL